MNSLLKEIRSCRACESFLPCGPRPIVQAHTAAQLLIVGQAPGLAVHQTGIPWNDPSGERLRDWIGLSKNTFYNPEKVAIAPIGFCYPGRAKSGDASPRPECYPLWHSRLRSELPNVRLTLLIGRHAQARYLNPKLNMSSTVRSWQQYLPGFLPMPHPSPRNNIWLRKNPWFEEEALSQIRALVASAIV